MDRTVCSLDRKLGMQDAHPLRADILDKKSDAELVQLLIAGNQDAMAAIFDRYYRMVMRVALHIVRDLGEAQDVAQIVFTDFYRKASLFDPTKGNLKTWLLQYAYGRSINRKQSLRLRNFYDHAELDEVDSSRSPVDTRLFDLETPEAARLVEQILSTLGDRQRQVIEMVCFRGMTMAEVAASTGESFGNIQHSYYRGIDKLRAYLRTAEKEVKCGTETKRSNQLFGKLQIATRNMKETEVEIAKTRAI